LGPEEPNKKGACDRNVCKTVNSIESSHEKRIGLREALNVHFVEHPKCLFQVNEKNRMLMRKLSHFVARPRVHYESCDSSTYLVDPVSDQQIELNEAQPSKQNKFCGWGINLFVGILFFFFYHFQSKGVLLNQVRKKPFLWVPQVASVAREHHSKNEDGGHYRGLSNCTEE
jgi:hypothetical protein